MNTSPSRKTVDAAAKSARSRRDEVITERLLTGETVVRTAIISNYIYWHSVAVFILALLVAVFIAAPLGALLGGVSVLLAIYAILRKEILMLVVTNKRILVRYGILQVDVVDLHFDKVESIELERMITGYLMGYANVVIMGTGNRYIVIPFVHNAIDIRRAYNEQVLGNSPVPPVSS